MNSPRAAVATMILGLSAGVLSGCSNSSQATSPVVPATATATVAAGGPAVTPGAKATPTVKATAKALTRAQLMSRPIPPKPVKPVMPKIARTNTTQGAEAFVKHYFATLDYANRTGNWRLMDPLNNEMCEWCTSRREQVRKMALSGDRVLDPVHMISVKGSVRVHDSAVLVYTIHQPTKDSRFTENGKLQIETWDPYKATFAVLWNRGAWTVTGAGSRWQDVSEVHVKD